MNTSAANQIDSAFVLHTRPYRNTSLIVDMFSREQGRLSVVAKAARAPTSAFYGSLQPFMPLYIQVGGQGELGMLFKAESLPGSVMLQGENLYSGFYLNELLIRLLHRHDPHPELFDVYQSTLSGLHATDLPDVVLRYFELQLLEALGYAMNLTADAMDNSPIQETAWYRYRIDHGPVAVADMANDQMVIPGAVLLALSNRTLAHPEHRQLAKRLMRSVLDFYLGQKPLKTRELYRQFRH